MPVFEQYSLIALPLRAERQVLYHHMHFLPIPELSQGAASVIYPLTARFVQTVPFGDLLEHLGIPVESLGATYKGDLKECSVAFSSKLNRRVILVGLGQDPEPADVLSSMRSVVSGCKKQLTHQCTVVFDGSCGFEPTADMAEALYTGFRQGAYQIQNYKTEPTNVHPLSVDQAEVYVVTGGKMPAEVLNRADVISQQVVACMHVVNHPPNIKTPAFLADLFEATAQNAGVDVMKLVGRDTLTAHNLHGILAVNQGSATEPAFVVLRYNHDQTQLPHIGLVGKGITFDTGGYNIKSGDGMLYMKSDMAGAASVWAAVIAAAQLGLPVRISAALSLTDNSIDGKAYRASDVIKTYSGRTIEVIDTDAEGRIVLADGLSYIVRNDQPDVLLDVATLTGAVIRALGYHAAGLFTHSDPLAGLLTTIGRQTGEKLWRLPLWDVYAEETHSDMADIRNLGSKPMAGGTVAAKFLEVFADKHPQWAHIDIAGTAFGQMEYTGILKSATGYGVRLLVNTLEYLGRHGLKKLEDA
jgi:leucyl aminopeptidase